MSAQAAGLRERYEGHDFRWAFWQVALWAIGIGAALAGAVVLGMAIVSGGSTDAVLWVSIGLWSLLLGGVVGAAMAVLALILRWLAHGGAPIVLLRSLLGVAAALATSAALVWISGGIGEPLLARAGFLVLGVAIGWFAQHITFARRRAGAAA